MNLLRKKFSPGVMYAVCYCPPGRQAAGQFWIPISTLTLSLRVQSTSKPAEI